MSAMDAVERLHVHSAGVSADHISHPTGHLYNPRDRYHHDYTCAALKAMQCSSVLDIGCWDGWLDFLLIVNGYRVTGVELVPDLARAAQLYAVAQGYEYTCHCGFFDQLDISGQFDAVLAYEVLEHIALELVPAYVARMESMATKLICISLPDQPHEINDQHLWTPTESLIRSMWGSRPGFEITRVHFGMAGVPDDWLIKWTVA